jgi:hypothetical protein
MLAHYTVVSVVSVELYALVILLLDGVKLRFACVTAGKSAPVPIG